MNRTSLRLLAGLLESQERTAQSLYSAYFGVPHPNPEEVRKFWRRCRAGVPASGNPGIPSEVLALLHIRAEGPVSRGSVYNWMLEQSECDPADFAGLLDYLEKRGFVRVEDETFTCTASGAAWFDAGENNRRRGSR